MTREEYLNLVKEVNKYTVAYDSGEPKISDIEWDILYNQLIEYEKTTGYVAPFSPTSNIFYEVKNRLEKVTHNHEMLSLQKTKDISMLKAFIGDSEVVVMAKMDGLTCSLLYRDGRLERAETRGNGIIGEDITHNARVVTNIPKMISIKEEIVVDGEIICSYSSFSKFSKEFKNPRNFAAGSIRLLDNSICASRDLSFVAWDIVSGVDCKTHIDKLNILSDLHFSVVPFIFATNISNNIEKIREESKDFPIDGVVIKLNNIKEYLSKGKTSHHFNGAIAYKFYNDEYDTELIDIEWNIGRTGVLTPVAKFLPVEIDGSNVQSASLHNITQLHKILGNKPKKGQRIKVYKANEIIPQISWAEEVEGSIEIPKKCPVCGASLEIQQIASSKILRCTNKDCSGQLINQILHFIGPSGLDIEFLSKATIEKLISYEWVTELADILKLKEHREEWVNKPGFSEVSVDKILENIPIEVELCKIIASAGIPNVEKATAKDLAHYFNSWSNFRRAVDSNFDFALIKNIGEKTKKSLILFNYNKVDRVMQILKEKKELKNEQHNKSFCITGSLENFKNRNELIQVIENLGGEVKSGITKDLDFLISNNISSTSSKMRKAKELGVKIISEKEFMEEFIK